MIMFLCWDVFFHKNMVFNRHVAPPELGGVLTLLYRRFALTGLDMSPRWGLGGMMTLVYRIYSRWG
jgi:hypothetical protein